MNTLKIDHICFNAEAPIGVSDKYKFISTRRFVSDLETQGLQLVSFFGPRQGMGLHSMEFTHSSMPKLEGIDLRLYATNSHNGTRPFTLGISMLRQVCSNGLVATARKEEARVIHRGYALDKVKEALASTFVKLDTVVDETRALQSYAPNDSEVFSFVSEAATLRDARPFRKLDLLRVRRLEDGGKDAFTILNRVQEALVRGGYTTEDASDGISVPGPTARELKSVGERLKVNQTLWALAKTIFLKKG
jgi:hypothetical protein